MIQRAQHPERRKILEHETNFPHFRVIFSIRTGQWDQNWDTAPERALDGHLNFSGHTI